MGDTASEYGISDVPLIFKMLDDAKKDSNNTIEPRTKYEIIIFNTHKDYDIYCNNEKNNTFHPYDYTDIDDIESSNLWEYACFFDDELDADDYMFKDMTYQEFSNISKCKIYVRNSINDIVCYNPKIYDLGEQSNNVILIYPPAINKEEDNKKKIYKSGCIANFINENGLWYIKEKPIIRH